MHTIPLLDPSPRAANLGNEKLLQAGNTGKDEGKNLSTQSNTSGQCSARHVVTQLLSSCFRWFRLTTSSQYLNSKASRRMLFRTICPINFGLTAFLDLSRALGGEVNVNDPDFWGMIGCSVSMCVTSILIARHGALDNLKLDLAIWGGLFVYLYFCTRALSPAQLGTMVSFVPEIVACCLTIGGHAIFCSAFTLAVALLLYVSDSVSWAPMQQEYYTVVSLVTVMSCVAMEYWFSLLMEELSLQVASTQRLLDGATDGSATIHRATGQILCASPELAASLGLPSADAVVGRRLHDFVDDMQDSQIQLDMVGDLKIAPSLRTFRQFSGDAVVAFFDAVVFAFAGIGLQVDICIRKVGEVRPIDIQGLGTSGPTIPKLPPIAENVDQFSEISFLSSASCHPQRRAALPTEVAGINVDGSGVSAPWSLDTAATFTRRQSQSSNASLQYSNDSASDSTRAVRGSTIPPASAHEHGCVLACDTGNKEAEANRPTNDIQTDQESAMSEMRDEDIPPEHQAGAFNLVLPDSTQQRSFSHEYQGGALSTWQPGRTPQDLQFEPPAEDIHQWPRSSTQTQDITHEWPAGHVSPECVGNTQERRKTSLSL